MKTPGIASNETARLEALESYDVLDTDTEAAFDGLTELAAGILGVPIALVSLVDEKRQWFKSRHGLGATETPRDVSFCGHVVAEAAPLVVLDAFADARFVDNPLVMGEPRVRFYAGMPLRTPDGFVLGTLCAIDHEPRSPTPQQLHMLALLAGQVVDQLEARRKRRELAAKHAAVADGARRLSVLFDAMAEGVVVQDQAGVITAVNAAAERILGLTVDQMSGRSSTDPRWRCIHEDGALFPGHTHPAMVALGTGAPCTSVIMGVHKPNGELTWISINALPLREDGPSLAYGAITTFHDITALKAAHAAEERLSRQERLVTTGTLAAGVGHEINNPLTYILANIDFSLEELRAIAGGSPSGRLRELIEVLDEAREGGERIRKIVRGLRAFAREEAEPMATDVANAVEISINMAAHEIRTKATLSKAIVETPPALTDESRLSQVLVNLLVNAAQAFPSADPESNQIEISTAVEQDGRICVAVRDNGPGVAPDLQRRIFDPFFTTKPAGEGTGLGLSISQSIVTSLGGELLLESDVGKGATFRVLLPAAVAGLGDGATPSTVTSSPRGRVLVVDDEDGVLNSVRRSLAREHDVVALRDPRDALERINSGEQFDVVFCDLMMPHMTGDALYTQVRALTPEQAERFVFLSGGATDSRIQSFLETVPNERVDKPFVTATLREIARRLVEKRAAS